MSSPSGYWDCRANTSRTRSRVVDTGRRDGYSYLIRRPELEQLAGYAG
jgi:hypothetical protein